jgi:hypothetical protein
VSIVSSTAVFEMGGSENRISVGVSRRTVTGTASVSGVRLQRCYSLKLRGIVTCARSGLDGNAKRQCCQALQFLMKALSGRAFVRMGRNM